MALSDYSTAAEKIAALRIAFSVKKDDVVMYSIKNGSHIDLPADW